MTYTLTYTRDGRTFSQSGTRRQVQALADYLSGTFGIIGTIKRG